MIYIVTNEINPQYREVRTSDTNRSEEACSVVANSRVSKRQNSPRDSSLSV